MTAFQAILIGMLYWFYACYTPGTGFAHSLFFYPITGCLWVGWILGDIPTAMMVGAAIQPMYLAFSAAGGTVPTDKGAATIISTSAVIVSGLSIASAIVLAVPVGLMCAQLHTLRRLTASTWVHLADKYADEEIIKPAKFYIAGTVLPALQKLILFWLPMSLVLYFGTAGLSAIMDSIPAWLTNGLTVAGSIIPALGMAMTISVIGHTEFIPYLLAGFFMVQYSHLNNIALVILAAFVAFLGMQIVRRNAVEVDEEEVEEAVDTATEHLLTKRDVKKCNLWWWYQCEQANSFERLQALGFCNAMLPALRILYKDNPEELRAAVKRHLMFFNTENFWGAMIPGIVLSMEEQRAMGRPISEEAIINIKTGLMGPFAAIGDTIDWGTLAPIMLALFIPYAEKGYWWAGLIPAILIGLIFFLEGQYFFNMGYKLGTRGALKVLASNRVQGMLTFFSILGMFMIGGLSASYVKVTTPITIPFGSAPMSLQTDILDAIIPGILSLGLIFLVYAFLRKSKSKNAIMVATFGLIVAGIVLGALGILC